MTSVNAPAPENPELIVRTAPPCSRRLIIADEVMPPSTPRRTRWERLHATRVSDEVLLGGAGLCPAPSDSVGVRARRLTRFHAHPFWQIRKLDNSTTIFSVPFARMGVVPFGGRSVSAGHADR